VILSVSMLKLLGKTLIPLVHLILSIVMMSIYKAWLIWKSNFTKIIDKHAPLKKRGLGKTRAPWINKNLLTNKWRKNNLKRKACKTNNPSEWESYRIEKIRIID
jgi:hypothetical protein